MKKKGASLHMIDLGGDVTGNGIAKLVFTILSAVAEAERDRIRERVAVVKADQKTRGRYLGGKVPFGFHPGENGRRVEIPEEQEAISMIRSLKKKGMALRPIAALLGQPALKSATRESPKSSNVPRHNQSN
jgi:putative DNA-invertase from lambdoid prophage Rac